MYELLPDVEHSLCPKWLPEVPPSLIWGNAGSLQFPFGIDILYKIGFIQNSTRKPYITRAHTHILNYTCLTYMYHIIDSYTSSVEIKWSKKTCT